MTWEKPTRCRYQMNIRQICFTVFTAAWKTLVYWLVSHMPKELSRIELSLVAPPFQGISNEWRFHNSACGSKKMLKDHWDSQPLYPSKMLLMLSVSALLSLQTCLYSIILLSELYAITLSPVPSRVCRCVVQMLLPLCMRKDLLSSLLCPGGWQSVACVAKLKISRNDIDHWKDEKVVAKALHDYMSENEQLDRLPIHNELASAKKHNLRLALRVLTWTKWFLPVLLHHLCDFVHDYLQQFFLRKLVWSLFEHRICIDCAEMSINFLMRDVCYCGLYRLSNMPIHRPL